MRFKKYLSIVLIVLMIFVYAGCDEAESTEPYDTYKKIDAVYTSDDGNYNIAVVVWNHVSYEFLNVNIICIENKTNIFRELSSFTVLDPYSDYQTDLPRYKFDSYGSYAKLQVQTFGDDYEDMTIYWDEIMQYS